MMYFTETEVLRELEILMQMIPGFQPKGYGSMVMPDQIYIYLQEPPPPTYQEMIADTMHAVRYRPFLQRVEELLAITIRNFSGWSSRKKTGKIMPCCRHFIFLPPIRDSGAS